MQGKFVFSNFYGSSILPGPQPFLSRGTWQVLKDGQMSYVRHMLAEKQMLQDQANQLVGLLDNLLARPSPRNPLQLDVIRGRRTSVSDRLRA